MEILLLIPVVLGLFALFVVLSAVPLYFALKIVNVNDSFLKAFVVNCIAGGISFFAGFMLNLVGAIIPVLPTLLSLVLPLIVMTAVVMQAYELEMKDAAIVSVIQYIVSLVIVVGIVFAAITLGLGGALLAGAFA